MFKLRNIFSIDLRSLALFRITIGSLVLMDLSIRSRDLTAHYTDSGIMPRSLLASSFGAAVDTSLYMINGTETAAILLFLATAMAALAVILGLHTRIATFLVWVLLISLHNRNTLIEHGADVILRMMFFWSVFLPLGSKWSLDAMRRSATSKHDSIKHGSIYSFASAALLLQIVFIYWFTAVLKSGEQWHSQGNAVYMVLSANQYTSEIGGFFVTWLRQHQSIVPFLTRASFNTELIAATLLLVPLFSGSLRNMAIFLIAGLHLGIALYLDLGMFPWVDLATLIPFIPSSFWQMFSKSKGDDDILVVKNSSRHLIWNSLAQLIVVCSFTAVTFGNLTTVPQLNLTAPSWFTDTLRLFRLDQRWAMFAPDPIDFGGWFVMSGKLADGRQIDPFRLRGTEAPSWDKPRLVSSTYRNERWRLILTAMSIADFQSYRDVFMSYICRNWNQTHSKAQRMSTLEVYFMRETTALDYKIPEPKKELMSQRQCDGA